MTMIKKTAGVLLAILLPLTAVAQDAPALKSQYEVNRQVVETERQAIVAANLPLTEAEADAFWPVYREYRNAVAGLDEQGFSVVMSYAKLYNAGTLTDMDGTSLMDDAIAIEAKRVEERTKAWKKVQKVLPGVKAARYMQIENKLDAIRRFELAREIPLIEPAAN